MGADDALAVRFEARRERLRGLAYRMLGSLAEADDAVQEAWLRLSRAGASVERLDPWLTTVVARVCLDMLRARGARREEPLGPAAPEVAAPADDGTDPEREAALADAVGLALLVVLDRLTPPERVAFVLHDMFAVPFAEIGPVVGRSEAAAKQLASRARRRVRGARPAPDADMARRRRLVEAFLAAAREGDLRALLAVLDPDVVRRADRLAVPAGVAPEVRGARAVAEETRLFADRARLARVALVDGAPGLVVAPAGRLALALRIGVAGDRIAAIEVIAEPARLRRLELAVPAS